MPGLQEIAVLLGVVGAVLFGPQLKRLLAQDGDPPARATARDRKRPRLSGPMRLAIVASILVPVAAAVYFEPWNHNLRSFLYVGVGPVAIAWATWWVARGFRDR